MILLDGREAREFVRFRLERPAYLEAIEAARAGRPPLLGTVDVGPPTSAYFMWGGMLWAAEGVAYDESDEAGKPAEARSEAWWTRHKNSELNCDGAVMRSLGGHFYMVYGC